MIGVSDVKDRIRTYAKEEHGGKTKFKRVEIEGEFAFVGAVVKTGLIAGRYYVFTLHHPSGTVVAEEDLSEWGFGDPAEKMNEKIDEWINMSEQELRTNLGV